ncbi:MAG TPA: HIRAN domain-containing protein [Sphingomonas sp.]|nr:HIRAN domain-containing protein [Sphingomonas sp.]
MAVVGIPYGNRDGSNRLFEVKACAPGDPIDLKPEPRNKFDEQAVGVWRSGGGQMGYVAADRAAYIGKRMAEGYFAVFQGHVGSAAYIRIRFGGGQPTLPRPAVVERRSDDDDFFPDPDGPEFGA